MQTNALWGKMQLAIKQLLLFRKEILKSLVVLSVECSAAVRKKKANGTLGIIRKGRDNKTESLKSDLTDGDSSKWKGKVEGYNGDI